MALDLTVLGTCGSYPGPGGACSGYLVRSERATVWLDAGSGTMANLQRHVALEDVTAVVLSHGHMDHWSDVEGFSVALTYGLHRSGVPVYSPRSMRQHVASKAFAWAPVGDRDTVVIEDQTWTFSQTSHPIETYASRIDCGGASLVYTADTGPQWSISSLGDGCDLALMEATFLRHQERVEERGTPGVHLSARQAGLDARRSGAKAVLLTHLWPTNDPAEAQREGSEAYGAPVAVAEANRTYAVGT